MTIKFSFQMHPLTLTSINNQERRGVLNRNISYRKDYRLIVAWLVMSGGRDSASDFLKSHTETTADDLHAHSRKSRLRGIGQLAGGGRYGLLSLIFMGPGLLVTGLRQVRLPAQQSWAR
jgi:hypothetical protein